MQGIRAPKASEIKLPHFQFRPLPLFVDPSLPGVGSLGGGVFLSCVTFKSIYSELRFNLVQL